MKLYLSAFEPKNWCAEASLERNREVTVTHEFKYVCFGVLVVCCQLNCLILCCNRITTEARRLTSIFSSICIATKNRKEISTKFLAPKYNIRKN